MRRIISSLRRVYRKLPSRPLRGILVWLYNSYLWASGNQLTAATIDGITYELDLRELIDSTIYFEGCWEPEIVAAVQQLVLPGQVVLDIGANMGFHTLLFARLVGDKGLVVAFEPMSPAFRKLERNVGLNDRHNIVLEKQALSNTAGRVRAAFTTSWRLDLEQNRSSPEDVNFTTLDDYVQNHEERFPSLDLMKLDVDGHEFKVLQGGTHVIQHYKPIIIVELTQDSIDSVRLLQNWGYALISLESLREYQEFNSVLEAIPASRTINVIASMEPLGN